MNSLTLDDSSDRKYLFQNYSIKEYEFNEQAKKEKKHKIGQLHKNRHKKMTLSQGKNMNQTSIEADTEKRIILDANHEQKSEKKEGPGPGHYNISIPIIKPSYQTYQKKNNVILVKINHLGGTANFRSQEERFEDLKSIYYNESIDNPGPGSYQYYPDKANPNIKDQGFRVRGHYDIIQQIFRNKRQIVESIPSYELHNRQDSQYNGIPKHLQEIYAKRYESKGEDAEKVKASQKLQKLLKLKRMSQKTSIKSRNKANSHLDEHQKIIIEKQTIVRPEIQYFTETMQKMSMKKQKQDEKLKKIKQILQNSTFQSRRYGMKQDMAQSYGYYENKSIKRNIQKYHGRMKGCQIIPPHKFKEKKYQTVDNASMITRIKQERRRNISLANGQLLNPPRQLYNQNMINVLFIKERNRNFRNDSRKNQAISVSPEQNIV